MTTPTTPWYRQFWPWLLIGLPATVVVACIITIVIALNHPDPIVNDDWYKDGVAINQLQERDTTARTLGMSARVRPSGMGLQLSLTSREALPERIQLTLMHPTRDNADIQRILMLDEGRAETGTLPLGDTRHWYISIESLPETEPAWRIRGRWDSGTEMQLTP